MNTGHVAETKERLLWVFDGDKWMPLLNHRGNHMFADELGFIVQTFDDIGLSEPQKVPECTMKDYSRIIPPSKTKFDLENDINDCWNITSDLEALLWRHCDSEQGPLTEDEIANIIIGLTQLYNAKFERLTDTMCQVLRLNQYREE